MANMKLFRLPEDTSTTVEDFMTKFGLNDEFNRIFNSDEVKALIQEGFEETKADVEAAVENFPKELEEFREQLTNLVAENQLTDQEAFSENLNFYMRFVLVKSIKETNFIMSLSGREITDDFVRRCAATNLQFILDTEAFKIKVGSLHDMYLDLMGEEMLKCIGGDIEPEEQQETEDTDEAEKQIPDVIGDLLELLQHAGCIEVHVIPIHIGGDDEEDSKEESKE